MMMRKVMALLLAALMLLVFAACGGGDSAVGKYTFSHMEAMGMTLSAEAMAGFGMEASGFMLEMKDGGTFTISAPMDGEEAETMDGTWEKDGDGYSLTINGETVNAVYDTKEKTMALTWTIEGVEGTMVFKK